MWSTMNERYRVETILCLIIPLCCFTPTAQALNVDAADPNLTPWRGHYVFRSDQSTLVQTGGIAGVHRTYGVHGAFLLTIDYDTGTAWFDCVDANAVDEGRYPRTLDPNEVFVMTDLFGTVVTDRILQFTGKAAAGSNVYMTAILQDDKIHLVAATVPPAHSADYFLFRLDAVARRKYDGGSGMSDDPYQIAASEQLHDLAAEPDDWDKHFRLTSDIDLSGFWYDRAWIAPDTNDVEAGFQGVSFTGSLDGNGHTISHLTIAGVSYLGLFGQIDTEAQVRHLGVTDVNIIGSGDYIGALAGFSQADMAMIYSTGIVQGDQRVGGLMGRTWGDVAVCYSLVDVTGNAGVGGFAGNNYGSTDRCYSRGAVVADRAAGGFVGENYGSIVESYSAGPVAGNQRTGGFSGYNWTEASVVSSFWDQETSGQSSSDGGIGKTTADMHAAATYLDAGWDFVNETANGSEDIWRIDEDRDYPHLFWELD